MNDLQKVCSEWYEKSYEAQGFDAQRKYPNEELLRFFGRELFKIGKTERKNVRILELGCGSCSNLWMAAKEGFDCYGIDLSENSIKLGQVMLDQWGVRATLTVGSMTDLPYEEAFFNAVCDVFSTNCLCESEFKKALGEVKRVLKKGGIFFSYVPSVNSDAFKNYHPSVKVDEYTLDGIKRETSPYFGNFYPFRFISPEHYKNIIDNNGFEVIYLETVSRTYRTLQEYFEFVVITGKKK
jgi:ubiquinone/menaquinone biosynthesis C-methylase UbiE